MTSSPLVRAPGLLEDPSELHVLPLLLAALKKYGADFVTWPPEMVLQQMAEDFDSEIGQVTKDRIFTGQLLLANDMAWREWHVFEKVVAAVGGLPVLFSKVQPPEAEEMAIALWTMGQIAKDNEYSTDVKGYIAAALLQDGLWFPAPPFQLAEESLRDYFQSRTMDMPFDEVKAALSNSPAQKLEPTNSIQHQVNLALQVRSFLEEYKGQVAAQTRRLT